MWEGVIAAKVGNDAINVICKHLVIVLYRMVTVSPEHRIETDQVTNAIDASSGLGPLSRAEHIVAQS
jgi:hypothetical protein